MTTEKPITERATESGKGFAAECTEQFNQLDALTDRDDREAERQRESIEEDIRNTPLSVMVRGGWYEAGTDHDTSPEEFEILLGTGGPERRIIGTLEQGQPATARYQFQAWFEPWTDAHLSDEEAAAVLRFAGFFYFGE